MLTVLDIFSGIGGFSLGLERTGGFKTVAFCEIDPFCRQVLRKHWSDVPIHEDVTKLRGEDVGPVDVIAGGFPCQDISTAGRGEGIEGSRSGLWKEYARLVGEIRPRYVIVENVAALLGRGLDRVLGDLSEIGFDAEWHCIPASAVGAPHRRDRVWIVAYPRGEQHEGASDAFERPPAKRLSSDMANTTRQRCREAREHSERPEEWTAGSGSVADTEHHRISIGRGIKASGPERRGLLGVLSDVTSCRAVEAGQIMADSTSERSNGERQSRKIRQEQAGGCGGELADPNRNNAQGIISESHDPGLWGVQAERSIGLRSRAGDWATEPDVGRVAHGVPMRVDRLRSLGNAVVPQVVEVIGNAILESA